MLTLAEGTMGVSTPVTPNYFGYGHGEVYLARVVTLSTLVTPIYVIKNFQCDAPLRVFLCDLSDFAMTTMTTPAELVSMRVCATIATYFLCGQG